MRVHQRNDYEFIILRGRAIFSRAAYACVITQRDAFNRPSIYHVETFYGDDGRKVRSDARRYGAAVKAGKRGVTNAPFRTTYLPSGFPTDGLPHRERDLTYPA